MVKKTGLALGLVSALALIGAGVPASAAELKLASFVGPKHPMNAHFVGPWAKQIGEMSKGSLKISMHLGGSLGKGPAKQFKRAVDRVADITWGLQGYTSKQFRATTLIEMTNVGDSAVERTRRMWAVYDKYLAKEYKRVKVLAIWSLDAPILMTKNKPIKTIADLKGLKIRTPSQTQAKLVAGLGATPLAMPITKLYNALDRGLVDGVLVSPTVLKSFKINEVTRYYTTGLPWGSSPFFTVMNKASYDKLSPAHKDLINKTTGAKWSEKASDVYEKAGKRGMAFIDKSDKHQLYTLPAAEVKKGVAMLEKAEAKIIAGLEKEGVPATKILAAIRNAGS